MNRQERRELIANIDGDLAAAKDGAPENVEYAMYMLAVANSKSLVLVADILQELVIDTGLASNRLAEIGDILNRRMP